MAFTKAEKQRKERMLDITRLRQILNGEHGEVVMNLYIQEFNKEAKHEL